MSQLPNAPLKDITFRIYWHIENEDQLNKLQYLHGDFYNKIKNKFINRSYIAQLDLPLGYALDSILYEYSQEDNEFPKIGLGLNQMTVSTIDAYYDWKKLKEDIVYALNELEKVLHSLFIPDHYHLSLEYIDFLEFDIENDNVLDFLKNKLKINLNQSFYDGDSHPNEVNISLGYKNEIGKLSVLITDGQYEDEDEQEQEGIFIKTSAISNLIDPEFEKLNSWLDGAYKLCSNSFKSMTAGPLYDSFKMKKDVSST